MTTTHDLLGHLPALRLHRLGDSRDAGLLIASLPWPRARARHVSLAGRPTYVQKLGQWPGEPEGSPRRLLLAADGGNDAPEAGLALTAGGGSGGRHTPPTAEAVRFAQSQEEGYMWERHFLNLTWGGSGGKSVGLAMGLRHNGEVHWWEACRLVVLEETPTCRVIEMGGAIPRIATGIADLQKYSGYTNPFLHRHNWLYGHIYARLHSNGVCEIFAHHINSKFVDDGQDLEDVVPVLGIRTDAPAVQKAVLLGPWDGQRDGFELGGMKFDVSEVARLARPEQPGRFDETDGFLAWQPYMGAELFGGVCPTDLTGDPFIYHAQQRLFPRGMARTLRFSLSLSDRSPRVARYLAPAWWYGACEEFQPEPLLPVKNEYDAAIDRGRAWCRSAILERGFEDGSMPRYGNAQGDRNDPKRYEPGWEGELPYGQFLTAWRTGDASDYEGAMRSAWHFTDIAVDHAAKLVRMHGYPPHAFAIPMARVQACVAAWLETGDPYCLDAAEAVIEASHRLQKNAWPRLAVGRDAGYVRGALLLYRCSGNDHFRRIAREGAMMVVESQRPNGSFGDQGGGTGIHQWGAYITKPWMGLLATNGVLDYLELFPDEEAMLACVCGFADWLMSVRLPRDNGVNGWGYQHEYNGTPRHFDLFSGKWLDLPGSKPWHQDNLGRLMAFCTLRFEEPAYLDAWAESFSGLKVKDTDHSVSATYQFLPWVQAKLWRTALEEGGNVRVRPLHFGPRTPREGTVMTPQGPITLRWTKEGQIEAPAGVTEWT